MIIAVPLDEEKKDVCVSFGRAPFFMLANTEKEGVEILANPAAEAEGGAGLKAAQFVVDMGAEVLITVRCGENAGKVLKTANIKIYKSAEKDALSNIELLKEGKLEELNKFHPGFHGI